jgi:hypothetical protein
MNDVVGSVPLDRTAWHEIIAVALVGYTVV